LSNDTASLRIGRLLDRVRCKSPAFPALVNRFTAYLVSRLQLEELHVPTLNATADLSKRPEAADRPRVGAETVDTAERRKFHLLSSEERLPSFTFRPSFLNVDTDRALRVSIEELRDAELRVRQLSDATHDVFAVRRSGSETFEIC
jgi:hypothetical protein